MQNIEIKTSLPNPEATLNLIRQLGAKPTWVHQQRDVFFNVPAGYLKLRCVEGRPAELIAYQREAGTKPRPSDYDIARCEDGVALETALTRSLGIRGIVEKKRQLFLWQHTRIHVDQVRDLGTFLELETVVKGISIAEARAETDHVIAALALDSDLFLDRPYLELLGR